MTRPSEAFGLPRLPVAEGFPGRVDFVKSASKLTEAPAGTTLPEVAFCGRSNVGKSSLINTLCNRRQLARVSNTPGRTRLINFFDVQQRVMFVDLPGYGFATGDRAEVAAWGRTIQEYLQHRKQLVLTLLLLDARRPAEREEVELLMWFQATGLPTLAVLTKADKLNRSELERARVAAAKALHLPRAQVIPASALSRDGRDAVWGTILGVTAAQAEALAARLAPAPEEGGGAALAEAP
jgi:GTP-binding protein